jgi:L-2-hydroxyglutarate oxidase
MQTDVLIIGGGLVGLATAMHLQEMQPRLKISLCEKDDHVAAQQSGHNSGVLHAGIYYQPGSLKARLCVEGKQALIAFCERHAIPVVRCGKVVVANSEWQCDQLERLHDRGTDNGVADLAILSQRELREVEPHVRGLKALHSPHSAIVDYRLVAQAFANDFQAGGGQVHLQTEFVSAGPHNGRQRVVTTGEEFDSRFVINCAGLQSDLVAQAMNTDPGLRIIPFRGEFLELNPERRHLVKGLIYPVPNPNLPFLGVHITPMVSGSIEVGPNAILATRREGYRRTDFSLREFANTLSYPGFWRLVARNFSPGLAEINRIMRKSVFVENARELVPEIAAEDLSPLRAGVRAMAVDRKGNLIDDFRIEEAPGAIHVLNAPSPAATSSLMIGKFVASKAELRINAD